MVQTAVAAEPSITKLVEKVKLSDGREVEFAGKRKLLKDVLIDEKAGKAGVRLDFRNGETRSFWVPAGLMLQCVGHGISQKLGDETAGVEDVDDMVIFVDELIAQLEKGEWSSKREGNGFAGTSVLLRALVEHSGKTVEQMKAWLSTKNQTEKLALRNSKQLKPIIERLEAEKVSKSTKIDVDALLAGV